MIGNLAVIKHEPILGPELTIGDVLGYQEGRHERYFLVRGLHLDRQSNELAIQEYGSSTYFESHPSTEGNIGRHGGHFNYGLVPARRNFTRVITNVDKITKKNLCKVVIAAMFATDELRNLLVELEV